MKTLWNIIAVLTVLSLSGWIILGILTGTEVGGLVIIYVAILVVTIVMLRTNKKRGRQGRK